MHGVVSSGTVADANGRVEPDAFGWCERVIGVDEAALGGFEVEGGEGVGDAAEGERVDGCEGGGVECDCDTVREKDRERKKVKDKYEEGNRFSDVLRGIGKEFWLGTLLISPR